MLELETRGPRRLRLDALVPDVNGTLARYGELRPGVPGRLGALKSRLDMRLLSVDTFSRLDVIAAELGGRGTLPPRSTYLTQLRFSVRYRMRTPPSRLQ